MQIVLTARSQVPANEYKLTPQVEFAENAWTIAI